MQHNNSTCQLTAIFVCYESAGFLLFKCKVDVCRTSLPSLPNLIIETKHILCCFAREILQRSVDNFFSNIRTQIFFLQSGVVFIRDQNVDIYYFLFLSMLFLSMHLNFIYNKQGYEGKEAF